MAAVATVAEHSIMRQFAEGRPDARDEKELADFADRIRSKIDSGAEAGRLALPGIWRRSHEALRRKVLHKLRPLCERVPGGSNSFRETVGNRLRSLHFLYALYCCLSEESKKRQQSAPCRRKHEA